MPAICVVLILLMVGEAHLHAQGAADALGGLGEIVGSFFARDAYVGSTPVQLMRRGQGRSRLHLRGFSVDPPEGAEWYVAYSPHSRATVMQTVWFVKDPHRITAWAKGHRIPSRPSSLVAKLEFYGSSNEDFPARLKHAKAAEWASESVQVLSLETRPLRVANVDCAEYEARLVDRRAPPGFDAQPFLVTVAGRACPHPDAPWFTVDFSGSRRTLESDPPPVSDAGGDAFVRSLGLDTFSDGPIVEDVLLLDRAERPHASGAGIWIEGTALSEGAVWVSHRATEGPPANASKVLSRIDSASNRLTAQAPVRGAIVGVIGNTVWVFGKGTAWSLEAGAANAARELRVTCSPGAFWAFQPLRVGNYGVWLGCRRAEEGKRSARPVPGFLRRIDPITGATVADLEFPLRPGEIYGDAQFAWTQESSSDWRDKVCRLHAIDTTTNRVTRTVVLDSSACRHMAIVGDEGWMVHEVKGRDEIAKVDLAAGRIVASVPVPKDRFALDVAVGRDLVWVTTIPKSDDSESGARLGSKSGLVRIDRATATLTGTMVPTGTADRLIGVQDGAVWLYDSEGAILRVPERRSVPRH